MASKKPQFAKEKTFATPVGVAKFPWLTKADTEYDDDGVYHTGLALDPELESTQQLIARLEDIRDRAVEAVKEATGKKKIKVHPIVSDEYEKDENDEKVKTGRIVIHAKTKAVRKGKNNRRAPVTLTIVDAKKKPHPSSTPIYGGSKLRLAVWPGCHWTNGTLYVTLYIMSVQVIELQTSSGGTDLFDEEDGYEAAASDDPFDDEDSDVDDDEDDDDDDEDDSDLY